MKLLKRSAITAACLAGVLTLTATPAAAIVDGQEATRIYRGVTALSVLYPGLGILKCGAALITPRHVLTAGHCVSDITVAPTVVPATADRITVRIGSNDRTTGGQEAVAAKVLIHPDWAWLQAAGQPIADIAIVELDRPVRAPLTRLSPRPAVSGPARIIGWGLTEYPVPAGTELPNMLRQRDVTVLPTSACAGGGIGAGEICVSPGACFGDSGSPALQPLGRHASRSQASVGIASRETNTDNPCGSPVIYTDAAFYLRWIAATIIKGAVTSDDHAQIRSSRAASVTPFSYLIRLSR